MGTSDRAICQVFKIVKRMHRVPLKRIVVFAFQDGYGRLGHCTLVRSDPDSQSKPFEPLFAEVLFGFGDGEPSLLEHTADIGKIHRLWWSEKNLLSRHS
jgi:hypothetical protein